MHLVPTPTPNLTHTPRQPTPPCREDPASRRSSTSGGLGSLVHLVPTDQVAGAPRDRERDSNREAERGPQGPGGLVALDELGILDATAAM